MNQPLVVNDRAASPPVMSVFIRTIDLDRYNQLYPDPVDRDAQLARSLIKDVSRSGFRPKPFCIKTDARMSEPFLIHSIKDSGFLCEPLSDSPETVPPRGLALLKSIDTAGYPVTDVRICREVAFLGSGSRVREASSESLGFVTMVLGGIARDIADSLISPVRRLGTRLSKTGETAQVESPMERGFLSWLFNTDPLLAVRIGTSGIYVELIRWNQR
jgi:hypothetical protein